MWFEKWKSVCEHAGRTHEMKGMMTDDVIPALLKNSSFPAIAHRTLLTAGIGESVLADLIQPWGKPSPHVKLAYLPNYGMVRLRLENISGNGKASVIGEIDQYFTELQQLVRDYMVTNADEPLEVVVGKLLLERNPTMATARKVVRGIHRPFDHIHTRVIRIL